ncbi:MAG TPA: MaoC family dehydratase N-terminal domain-containing protein [Variovorax sp.]
MISKRHEGRSYPPYRLRLDRAVGRNYFRALGLDQAPVEVPLTYLIFLRGEKLGVDLFRDLDIPREQALHAGQRYEWFKTIGWDDALDVNVRVERVTEKASKSGPLWFADVVYDYRDAASGELAVRETTRLIKRSAP